MRTMTRIWMAAIASVAVAVAANGCGTEENPSGGAGSGGTAGSGGRGGSGGSAGHGGAGGSACTTAPFSINGTVALNPIAQAANIGTTLPKDGLTVRIVDPIKAIATPPDPTAVLETTTTDANGNFSFTNVDVSGLTIGAVVTVVDAAGRDNFATSTMAICTPAFTGTCFTSCQSVQTGSTFNAFVVPTALTTALETATGNTSLLADGFILGLVANATTNTPIADVQVTPGPGDDLIILSPTLSEATGTTTTASGSFIDIPATSPTTISVSKTGTTFANGTQSAGKTANVVFQLFFLGT